jgi:anti-anti-sigma factor
MPEFAYSEQFPVGGAVDGSETVGGPAENHARTLGITAGTGGDRVVVKVSGELDLDTGEQLEGALREAVNHSVRGVELDLRDVEFCDCSALNALLSTRRRALAQAKTLAIHSASPAVERLLDMTGTLELFPGVGSVGPAAAPRFPRDEEIPGSLDEDLRTEVAQLRRAMQTRPTIDLARGILMASFSLSSEEAWTVLVAASQNTNTKLHRLAGHLVTAVKGDALPPEVQEQLSSAVTRIQSSSAAAHDGARGSDPAPVRGGESSGAL